jgi:hypothetical protein
VTPDSARRDFIGNVSDLEAIDISTFAALAASKEYPLWIASQHAAMAAFVHLGIIG